MNYQEQRVTDIHIAYIGGGSRGWAWNLIADLALESTLCGTVYLYDIDKAAAMENATVGNRLAAREDCVSPWHYEVTDTLDEALSGADFVLMSILPGTFEEMRFDVELPMEYGVYQLSLIHI